MAKTHYIIPIFIPHRGCPFDCVFCNQKKITGYEGEPTNESINDQIEKYLGMISSSEIKHVEVGFFGGSFTGIGIEKQKEFLSVANSWKLRGKIHDIRISTRPDYINSTIMELLQDNGVSIIELGVQSMDNNVLQKSGRGHTAKDVRLATKIIKEYGIRLGLQMMIGLPGDTKEIVLKTTKDLIDLEPDFVRVYPTLVIKDTYLETLYSNGLYAPLKLEEAVDITKEVIIQFMKHDISVIRVGLQTTDELLQNDTVIAGPFHPAFRQLVEEGIIRDFIVYILSSHKISKAKITIECNGRMVSNVVGQQRKNLLFFKKHFAIESIKILTNDSLDTYEIAIRFNNKELNYKLNEYIKRI